MSEHLLWCKSLQDGTAVDCDCKHQRKIIWERYDTKGAMDLMYEKEKNLHLEIARLREAIEKADVHDTQCEKENSKRWDVDATYNCICKWKRTALEPQK